MSGPEISIINKFYLNLVVYLVLILENAFILTMPIETTDKLFKTTMLLRKLWHQ